jgi:geranylgeranyl reductase family protein
MRVRDVIVIGGGPTGNLTACRLARLGHDVVVIEKRTSYQKEVCCTGIISCQCIDEFNLDNNYVIELINQATIYPPSGRKFKLKRSQYQAAIINRASFDFDLMTNAEKAGANYMLGCTVQAVETNVNTINITFNSDDISKNIQSRAVVLASGFNPNLSAMVGLSSPSDFAIGIQAKAELKISRGVELYLGRDFAPGFFAWVVPLGSKQAKIGLICRRHPYKHFKKLVLELERKGDLLNIVNNPEVRLLPLKPAKKIFNRRVVSIGDAAGQNKPTTGGGLYYGLVGADMAAICLNEALRLDDLSENCLSEYQDRWQRRIAGEIRWGRLARIIFEHLGDKEIDYIFRTIIKSGIIEEIALNEQYNFDRHGQIISDLITRGLLPIKNGRSHFIDND